MKLLSFSEPAIFKPLLNLTKDQTVRLSARLNVGDEVKIFWTQRSKFKRFCAKCGKGAPEAPYIGLCDCLDKTYFNKILGIARIKEKFPIYWDLYEIKLWLAGKKVPLWSVTELAERDGFTDFWKMQQLFDKNYDLSKGKIFTVYRFEWITRLWKL